jgi:outer membrane protein
MKRALIGACAVLFLSQTSFAVDLITVYQQALSSDPVFKQALATYQSDMEKVPQAVAVLLPNLSLSGEGGLEKDMRSGTAGSNSSQRTLGFGLSLTQTVFNFAEWKALSSASYTVKASQATYSAAAQDLMIRTATAYFNVLEKQEILKQTIANKTALYQTYQQAKVSYEVGLKAITDVYDAKASYDQSVATYVGAKNDVDNAKEDLRQITGEYYTQFAMLEYSLPLIVPAPRDIDQWVGLSNQQNWNLISARYTVLAARETLTQQRAGHLPTLGFSADYDNTNKTILSGATSTSAEGAGRTRALSAALTLSLPIFSGGMTSSQVRQALAQAALADEQREQSSRTAVNDTRKAYLAIVSGIQTVQADQQTIKSNQSALEGTREGYKVGTRTMVDVLIAQSSLFTSLQQYAKDRYAYVISLLTLKQAAGTLSGQDLVAINQWLQENPVAQKSVSVKKEPQKESKKEIKKAVVEKKVVQETIINKPGIYLQVGAFSQKEHADQIKEQVQQITQQSVVVEKNGLYRVKLGPVKSEEVALNISDILQQAGFAKPIITNE